MIFHVLTLFPEMIVQGLHSSIIGRAVKEGRIVLDARDIREYAANRHRQVDDYPYGGGAGMLMQAQPVFSAYQAAAEGRKIRTIYVTPQGSVFTQKKAKELAQEEELLFLCGHYEGIDERVLEEVVTDYISIGDYVLTGGELPAMVMIDAIARLIPGVLGNTSSSEEESFHNDLLEYPQYTRPEVWHGKKVPEVLLSGNHSRVAAWRLEQSIVRTGERRRDLYAKYLAKQRLVELLSKDKRNHIHMMESLSRGQAAIMYTNEYSGGKDTLLYDERSRLCMICADDAVFAKRLIGIIPEEAEHIVAMPSHVSDMLVQKQFPISCQCIQALYTLKTALPVKHKSIRQLTPEDKPLLEKLTPGFCRDSRDNELGGGGGYMADGYMRERILAGALYGIFTQDGLAGVIGIHKGGSLGMLYVEPAFRRQGYAAALTAYAVNRMLEKGWTPYGYVPADDEKTLRLLEKLRFYQAAEKFTIHSRRNLAG